MMPAQIAIGSAREAKLRKALFRGDELRLENPEYLCAVRAILGELLDSDIGGGDLTAAALGLARERPAYRATGRVLAKEPGVAAGIAEYCWLLGGNGIEVTPRKKDGDTMAAGDTLLEIAGERGDLLACERVGLNLLQRMSGIATATRNLQDLVRQRNPAINMPRALPEPTTRVVGTRKTPWGLLDKRALHLGGGGTHRLSLADAILVKNNHLALLSGNEAEAACEAARRAWTFMLRAAPAIQSTHQEKAAFIEVEVRCKAAALAAAGVFAELQESDGSDANCPCLLLLDNLQPAEVAHIVAALRDAGLLESVLIEASGNISQQNIADYAACGADALSVGALTHSAQSLDICQRIP